MTAPLTFTTGTRPDPNDKKRRRRSCDTELTKAILATLDKPDSAVLVPCNGTQSNTVRSRVCAPIYRRIDRDAVRLRTCLQDDELLFWLERC